ncbi:MAG: hypothetical protein GXP47_10180 [Acidobacteria bacterium]|nr:hypothetical protein [Acidobacteriota bacterium]
MKSASTTSRVPLAVLWGALLFILASIGWGLHAHWALALPAAGLLRFAAWVLHGIAACAPILALGALIVRLAVPRATELPGVVALSLRWAVGSIAVTAAGIVLLACGIYSPLIWQALALVIWLGILAWLLIPRRRLLATARASLDGWIERWRTSPWPIVSWEALLLLLGALSALAASLPPDTRDELAYHLVIPKLWSLQGNWWVPTSNFHLLFPANTEILWGWATATGGPLAPRFLTLLFSALTVALLWQWLDGRAGGRWSRNLTLVFLLSAPLALTSMSICYVEWPLLLFLLLGWRLSTAHDTIGGRHTIWLTALLWGMTLGMKYTAFLFTGLLCLEWLARLGRRSWRQAVTGLLALAVASGALAAPWLVRNALATGDPVVPLGAAVGLGATGQGDLPGLTGYVHLQGPWRWAASLYHATADPTIDHRLHPGWPLLLALVVLIGWRWRRELPWFTVVVSTAVLLPFSPAPRIELPLLLLTVLFLPRLLSAIASQPTARGLATAAVAVLAAVSIPLSAYYLLVDGGPAIPQYLLGMANRHTYLTERGVLTPAMEWVRHETPANARLWVWCDDRVLYFDRWVRPDGPFDPPAFLSALEHGGAPALAELARNIDFIAIRQDHRSPSWDHVRVEDRTWKIPPPQREALQTWIRDNLHPVFRGPHYMILTPSTSPKPRP